jgi:hypothetical protein
VVDESLELKRGHESGALGEAARPLALRQILYRFTGHGIFGFVVAFEGNILQLQAGVVQLRRLTDSPPPPIIVPGNANRDVLQEIVLSCAHIQEPPTKWSDRNRLKYALRWAKSKLSN